MHARERLINLKSFKKNYVKIESLVPKAKPPKPTGQNIFINIYLIWLNQSDYIRLGYTKKDKK